MTVVDNLAGVRARISAACKAVDRDFESVRLIAVSKGHDSKAIAEACFAGQKVFGENYVKELAIKAAELRDAQVEWRFIGHLQRNKVKDVLSAGASVDSLDSLSLAEEIDRRAQRIVDVMIQVNVGREPQKSGCLPEDLGALLFSVRALPALRVRGLLCIPPPQTSDRGRQFFKLLRTLADDHGLPECSMGMSDDLEVAIEEGATEVRIGTAIFGPRPSRRG